jgi:uncharacterized protein involved in exopolysaccharide biosynthesis
MEYIVYLLRGVAKKLPWIVLGTILVTAYMFMKTKNMRGAYNVETTLYTGVISGYGIEDNNSGTNYAIAQNAMDNLINIIQSENTLRRVGIRLFSKVLVDGNPNEDVNDVTAASYRMTYNHLKNSPDGKYLVSLIDRSSQEKTVENFLAYEKQDKNNYIYGLFYYQHPYYSLSALRNVNVTRLGSSDLLKLKYSSGDPGIAYNTIRILEEEFVREYQSLRYGETDKVINYFREELARIGEKLSNEESDLTQYNVNNQIINYSDETKEVAAINKEYDLREQDIRFKYNSSRAAIAELEKQMQLNEMQSLNSIDMLSKLKQASSLTSRISELETMTGKDTSHMEMLNKYKKELAEIRKDLSNASQQYVGDKYSKSGMARSSIIEQWLEQTLEFEQAKAQLAIIEKNKQELQNKYVRFAPVGTTIKQKERLIGFTEQSYLANLKSYNDALLRKKNLEMTSASIKVLNPAAYPISTEKTKRKTIVIAAFFGTFVLLTGFFLLIELIDRTLKDSLRAEKLTKCEVLGVYPAKQKDSVFDRTFQELAVRNLSSTILPFFHTGSGGIRRYKLNLLSFEENSNKKSVAESLQEYWGGMGIPVKVIEEGVDFSATSGNYMTAEKLEDIYTPGDEKILIVLHQDMSKCGVTTPLLKDADVNLLVVSANYGWKRYDDTLLTTLKEQLGDKPYLCLSDAPDYDLEKFVGMLPPSTAFRKIYYRASQLSIAEIFRQKKDYFKKRKSNTSTLGSDDDV